MEPSMDRPTPAVTLLRMDYLIRYGHYLGFLLVFAGLVSAHLLVAPSLGGRALRKLANVDLVYLIGAVLVLGTMMAMLVGLGFGKGPKWYMQNGIFHAKLSLFVVVLLLSLGTSLFFQRNRKHADDAQVALPKRIKHIQRLQLLLVLVLPFLGLLLARGVGGPG
jgi:putative membrane protein